MLDKLTIPASAYLRSHAGRICVAIQGSSVDALMSNAAAALADSRFLEFRLDSLGDAAQAQAALEASIRFLSAHKDVAAIATCRRERNGGGFSGDLAQQLAILSAAACSGFAIIDLEIEAAEECSPAQMAGLRDADARLHADLMISYHDFQFASSPAEAFARIERFTPELTKIVNTARSLTDSADLLRWIGKYSGAAQLVAISMGEPGIVSRVLSLRAGSAFTFAAAPDGAQTASGQLTAHTLKHLYQIEQLDHATRIYGVAGNPVAHSLSPLMQNTAFHRERINAVYLPLKTDSLDDLLNAARQLSLSGMSITMPFKQSIMAHLANVDPLTAKIGACNTIRTGADGKLYGFNTDVAGIVRPLESRMALKGAKILVLGAGGAARAAVFGLAEKGAHVSVWSRSESKARDLAAQAHVACLSRKQVTAQDFDVLIHATPCGMIGNSHPLPLECDEWNAGLVFDLVYNPLDTPLLAAARTRSIPVIQGVEMFVHQGARQFEIWTGKPAPAAEMLRVVLHTLTKTHVQEAKPPSTGP